MTKDGPAGLLCRTIRFSVKHRDGSYAGGIRRGELLGTDVACAFCRARSASLTGFGYLSMAGVALPKGITIRGRDFTPLLKGESVPWNDDLYAEYSMHHGAQTQMRGYRTPGWKLMQDFASPGRAELYDLTSDPHERNNLIARGHWLEVPDGAAIRTNDGVLLCPVMSGSRFYDSTAQADRILCQNGEEAGKLEKSIRDTETGKDVELEEILSRELLSQRKPRTKNGSTKSAPSASASDNPDGGLAAEA